MAVLLVDLAKLRDAPRLSGREVAVLRDLGRTSLTVIGDPVDGWYHVRIDGHEGWVFGAFIVPPAEGLTVLRTWDEEMVVLRDADGWPLGRTNESGSFALATSTRGTLWPVILPEGGTAFVDARDVRVIS